MSEVADPIAGPEDIRPVVRTASAGNLNVWIFGGVLLIGGFLLFQALDTRRQDLAAPATQVPAGSGGLIAAPPPLSLPPGFGDPYGDSAELLRPARQAASSPGAAPQPQVVTRIVERPVPMPPPIESTPLTPAFTPRPSVVFADSAPQAAGPAALAERSNERVLASRLANPSLTVPKGTVIASVLETALDSTRAGGARAIVSRDVLGFDGTRVLIPRGSRLYGEYQSDMSLGQKRALVRWQRLTRPDGVIINLDSPAADPLGRAGVTGKVNTHFFERFGSAILQSVLDIGVGVATRSVSDTAVIVGLPGSTQQVTGQAQLQQQIPPTLRVRQGTSVSVFVARDLDFSSVDR